MITPVVRCSFVYIASPRVITRKDKKTGAMKDVESYEVTALVSKHDSVAYAALMQEVNAAIQAGTPKILPEGAAKLSQFRNPLRDGDAYAEEGVVLGKDRSSFRGNWFFTAKTLGRCPGIVDRFGRFMEPDGIYPGCYVRLDIRFAAYNNESIGVTAYLNNVMFVRDGERLGGGAAPAPTAFAQYIENAPDAVTMPQHEAAYGSEDGSSDLPF
jgi:hypothetical protein